MIASSIRKPPWSQRYQQSSQGAFGCFKLIKDIGKKGDCSLYKCGEGGGGGGGVLWRGKLWVLKNFSWSLVYLGLELWSISQDFKDICPKQHPQSFYLSRFSYSATTFDSLSCQKVQFLYISDVLEDDLLGKNMVINAKAACLVGSKPLKGMQIPFLSAEVWMSSSEWPTAIAVQWGQSKPGTNISYWFLYRFQGIYSSIYKCMVRGRSSLEYHSDYVSIIDFRSIHVHK